MGKLDLSGPRPPYLSIANDLTGLIASGQLPPGEKLPAISALAKRYEVAPGTIQSALTVLRDRGAIVTRRGTGSFVREDLDLGRLRALLEPEHGPAGDFAEVLRLLNEILERLTVLERRIPLDESERVRTDV